MVVMELHALNPSSNASRTNQDTLKRMDTIEAGVGGLFSHHDGLSRPHKKP